MRSPKELFKLLSNKVVGQDEVKKALALAVFNHCVSADFHESMEYPTKLKNNMLIVGPTGCGKTYLMDTLKDLIWLPVFHINALEITAQGWAGNGIDDYLETLRDECKAKYAYKDWEFALNHAIIFIDEFDKLCVPAVGSGGSDHHKLSQYALLKFIEGCDNYLQSKQKVASIDSRNMLIILGGNFEELRTKIHKLSNKQGMGFVDTGTRDVGTLNAIHKELIATGMVQELAGRIATVVEVKKLTRKEYRTALLNHTDGAIMPYARLWEYMTGTQLRISNYYINKIIDMCETSDLGARGLHSAIEFVLRPMLYEIVSNWDECVLNHETETKRKNKDLLNTTGYSVTIKTDT